MLAKLTSKNQLTLPKSVLDKVSKTTYFEVEVERGRIILIPVQISRADAVREKLAQLGITEQDVEEAVQWARRGE